MLPKIADVFEITLDELFERSVKVSEQPDKKGLLPWEDDKNLRAVIYVGQKLVQINEMPENLNNICKQITLEYEGPMHNIETAFNVSCGDVGGSVNAGGDVECGNVGGYVYKS